MWLVIFECAALYIISITSLSDTILHAFYNTGIQIGGKGRSCKGKGKSQGERNGTRGKGWGGKGWKEAGSVKMRGDCSTMRSEEGGGSLQE